MLDLGQLRIGVKVDGAEKAKGEINGLGTGMETAGTKMQGVKGKVGGLIKSFGKMAAAAAAAFAVREVVQFGKACVKSFADYQQMVGGVEKLFGKSADIVEKNAENAYKTAGISANKYMEQATSFSASLINACHGHTKEAANAADMAIRDMSDNANVFGTDMGRIQDAYQGFAKMNYTMLDNLKLGYGGTKTEMERLLADAGKLTGKKYDITNLKDVYEAIHAIQVQQKITGTTAKEAAKTVEGSLNMLKGSWDNFKTHIGSGKGVGKATSSLIKSVGTYAKNMLPVIGNIAKSMGVAFLKGWPKLATKVAAAMSKLADKIFDWIGGKGGKSGKAADKLMDNFIKGILKATPKMIKAIIKLGLALLDLLGVYAMKLIKYGGLMVADFAKGLVKGGPHPIKAIKKILKNIGKSVKSFSLKDAAAHMIGTIKDGFISKWHAITGWVSDKIAWIKSKFKSVNLLSIGKAIINSLWDGLKSAWNSLKTWVSDKVAWIKDAFNGAKDSGGGGGSVGGGKGAGHRNGLGYVPYDDYPALLHRGERVLTRAEASRYNEAQNSGGNTTVNNKIEFNGNYNFRNKHDIDYFMEESAASIGRRLATT